MAEKFPHSSGQGWDDAQLGDRAGCGDGWSAEVVEVVAVGAGDPFDDSEVRKAAQLTGQCCGEQLREQADEVCPAYAVDIELGTLQGAQQLLFSTFEEVQSLDRARPRWLRASRKPP